VTLYRNGQFQTLVILSLGKERTQSTEFKAGWVSEPIWTLWRGKKPLVPAWNQILIPQSSRSYPRNYGELHKGQFYQKKIL